MRYGPYTLHAIMIFTGFKITSGNTGSYAAPLWIFRGWHLEPPLVLVLISNHVDDRIKINSKIFSKAISRQPTLTLPTLGTYFNFALCAFSPVAGISFLACLLVIPQRKVKLEVSSPSHRRMETWFEIQITSQ